MSAAIDGSLLVEARRVLDDFSPHARAGRVHSVVGLLVEVVGIRPPIGTFCEIEGATGDGPIACEVTGFRGERSLMLPLGRVDGVRIGSPVRVSGRADRVPSGAGCFGRVLDGLGRPIDGLGPLGRVAWRSVEADPVTAVARDRIERPLDVGVRALDTFTTLGEGMRMGLFAGSGVGKSTLLGQLASQADVDVAVVALIGERRREVREFLERDLGTALERSVVVVATSDEPAPLRTRAARTATAIAEGFRDEGRRVLLLMDSLTRFCAAQREIGLASGEPPTTRGYTPSVWSQLPRLVERAGTTAGRGSITGLYTVLVEGDDMNEPVADAVRGLLDGHVELSRRIAHQGRFPAVDVLASLSRVMPDVTSEAHRTLVREARQLLATYRDVEDLITVGAYRPGSDPRIDRACELEPKLAAFLAQDQRERVPLEVGLARLREILGRTTA